MLTYRLKIGHISVQAAEVDKLYSTLSALENEVTKCLKPNIATKLCWPAELKSKIREMMQFFCSQAGLLITRFQNSGNFPKALMDDLGIWGKDTRILQPYSSCEHVS